jgi:hypothetical protein
MVHLAGIHVTNHAGLWLGGQLYHDGHSDAVSAALTVERASTAYIFTVACRRGGGNAHPHAITRLSAAQGPRWAQLPGAHVIHMSMKFSTSAVLETWKSHPFGVFPSPSSNGSLPSDGIGTTPLRIKPPARL